MGLLGRWKKKRNGKPSENRRRNTPNKKAPLATPKKEIKTKKRSNKFGENVKHGTQIEEKEEKKPVKIPKKLLLSIARIAATMIIAIAVVALGIAGFRHATTTSYFAVSDAQVTGCARVSKEEIYALVELDNPRNIFKIDTENIYEKLIDHPWISDATVRRKLPRSVVINITERKPAAIVLVDSMYLVDEGGEVFKRWAPGDPIVAPFITGFTREQFINDEEEVRRRISDAIDLASRYRAAGLERYAPLSEIHRELPAGFSMTVGDEPFYVRFGRTPYQKKINRLTRLLSKIKRQGQRPAVIYFNNEKHPDRVTVKMKHEVVSSAKMEPKKIEKKRMSKI